MTVPFWNELQEARRVLIAGAGGGFDVFSGLPLYFALRSQGKEVFLANLSFSRLGEEAGRWHTPVLVEIDARSRGDEVYFPELHLARWFAGRGESVPIYAFRKTGVVPLTEAYDVLVDHLELDTIVLVDGGTDCLMRGDEAGLGTPEEDIASLAAVFGTQVPRKLLACLGFGIDHFHGVCHAQFLENVAALTRVGAFLGAWSLTPERSEARLFGEAVTAVIRAMPRYPSIVCTSILSAVEGQFGDHHSTERTRGSELFINPLMSLYWTFRLDAVAERLIYPEYLYQTDTIESVSRVIHATHRACEGRRWRNIPL